MSTWHEAVALASILAVGAATTLVVIAVAVIVDRKFARPGEGDEADGENAPDDVWW